MQPDRSKNTVIGGTRLKFKSRKVRNHSKNASQNHFYCFLKEIWFLKSGCSLKSPTNAWSRYSRNHLSSITNHHAKENILKSSKLILWPFEDQICRKGQQNGDNKASKQCKYCKLHTFNIYQSQHKDGGKDLDHRHTWWVRRWCPFLASPCRPHPWPSADVPAQGQHPPGGECCPAWPEPRLSKSKARMHGPVTTVDIIPLAQGGAREWWDRNYIK